MTEPELTPAQEDVVRRRLAAARHTEPMPDEVAERLDLVIAGLHDRPGDQPTETDVSISETPVAPVVDLAARWRRRLTQGLVAAAFVVVAGVGATQLAQSGNEADMSSGGAPAQAPEGAARDDGTRSEAIGPTGTGDHLSADRLPTVRPGHFRADALSLQETAAYDAALSSTPSPLSALPKPCVRADEGEAAIAVSYRQLQAALLYLRPVDDTRTVELYLCGDTTPLRRATVPATQP